jgi:hypothetical protein
VWLRIHAILEQSTADGSTGISRLGVPGPDFDEVVVVVDREGVSGR